MFTNKTFILCGMIYSFRNSKKVDDRQGLMAATRRDDETSAVGGSQCVVSYPDVTSNREARTIGRLKLALELVTLGFLTMTVLFIWQITQKRPAATDQVSRASVSDLRLQISFTKWLLYHILNSSI